MPAIDVKPVKVFTREAPCSKVEIWNCFRRGDKFVPRPVVQTRGEIGENVPKYLRREGFAVMYSTEGIDYLTLTDEGETWLHSGLVRYLELHPEKAAELEQGLPGQPAKVQRRTLGLPAKKTPPNRLKRSR